MVRSPPPPPQPSHVDPLGWGVRLDAGKGQPHVVTGNGVQGVGAREFDKHEQTIATRFSDTVVGILQVTYKPAPLMCESLHEAMLSFESAIATPAAQNHGHEIDIVDDTHSHARAFKHAGSS